MTLSYTNRPRFPDLEYAAFFLEISASKESSLFLGPMGIRTLNHRDVLLPDIHGFLASYNYRAISIDLIPEINFPFICEIMSRGSKIIFQVDDNSPVKPFLPLLQRFLSEDKVTILGLRPLTFFTAKQRGLLDA